MQVSDLIPYGEASKSFKRLDRNLNPLRKSAILHALEGVVINLSFSNYF